MATKTTTTIRGVELIAKPIGTRFQIPIGRTYKKYQPLLVLQEVENTDSEVFTNVIVYVVDRDVTQRLAIRHTYDFEEIGGPIA